MQCTILTMTLGGTESYYSHFTDEESKVQILRAKGKRTRVCPWEMKITVLFSYKA